MKKRISAQEGFTLVELLLAMVLFSTVMVIATVGFIGMNRTFARGVIRKELSESAQYLTDDVTRAIRTVGNDESIKDCDGTDEQGGCKAGLAAVCFKNRRYFWYVSANRESDKGGLYKDITTSCDADPSAEFSTVVPERFKVRSMDVVPLSELSQEGANPIVQENATLYKLSAVVTSGAEDSLSGLPDLDIATTEDPMLISCVGSTVNSSVRNCSVEKINAVISSRGLK